jgi:stage II sporulation protein E
MSHQPRPDAAQPLPSAKPARHSRRHWIAGAVTRPAFLFAVAFLLGRASIAHVVTPFGLAFFVVLTELLSSRRSWPALGVLLGAYLTYGWHGALLQGGLFLIYHLCRKAMFFRKQPDIHWMPFLAGLADTAGRLATITGPWNRYDIFMALSEGALVIILSLIFLQCVPLCLGQTSARKLRNDQTISLIIFIGSIITGLTGLQIHGISMAAVAIDFIVVTLAATGGVGVSTTAAIVVGVLGLLNGAGSIGDVAVLGFAGLLSGTLKEAKRFWVGIAFIGSTGILSVTMQPTWVAVMANMAAAGVASALVMMLPKSLLANLSAYIPGTAEYQVSEQQQVRRVRALLSEKINELGGVFDELSAAFAEPGETSFVATRKLVDEAVAGAARSVCSACPRRTKCWDKEGLATYQAIVHTVARLEQGQGTGRVAATEALKERCIRLDSMVGVLRRNIELTDRDAKWLQKLQEQSGLVSAQLSGVAKVIRQVAEQVEEVNQASLSGEEQVLGALEQLGLYVDHVQIVSLDPGKIEIEVTQPSQGAYENSVRMIAPLLSGIVGENITVSQLDTDGAGPCTSVFSSARLFDVETAVTSIAKDGRLVSGDSHTAIDLDNGRFALAVSDGMGNGERAHRESSAALELLKKLLKAGFDEQLAIQTVNSTLLLRSRDEIFTTLDMTLIDLYSARAEFLKIGSAPSFLKRGQSVRAISGNNVPIGILQDIEVQVIDEQLAAGDLLILMSDGVYDAAKHVYNQEDWLKQQIERLEVDEPQAIADTLVENAVRINHGQIADDMTVLVAKVKSHQPEWAAIRLPGVVGIRHRDRPGA